MHFLILTIGHNKVHNCFVLYGFRIERKPYLETLYKLQVLCASIRLKYSKVCLDAYVSQSSKPEYIAPLCKALFLFLIMYVEVETVINLRRYNRNLTFKVSSGEIEKQGSTLMFSIVLV